MLACTRHSRTEERHISNNSSVTQALFFWTYELGLTGIHKGNDEKSIVKMRPQFLCDHDRVRKQAPKFLFGSKGAMTTIFKGVVAMLGLAVGGCASVSEFPDRPENVKATLDNLQKR